VFHADQRAVLPRRNLAAVGPVFVEEMAHHAEPARGVHEIGLETDQAAHGDERLDGHLRAVMVMWVISAFRKARFSMIGPMCSCGISRKSFSMGSSRLPEASFFQSTSGRLTNTS